MNTIVIAAECEDGLAGLAQLGWPGVVALGLFLAAFVAFVWLVNR